MFGTILCVAAVTLGVEVGWEPNDNGGLEYIIQIDPDSLRSFSDGRPLRSDFPKDLRGLQTIRFQVGDNKLPRVALAPEKSPLLDPPSIAYPAKATLSPSDIPGPAKRPGKLATNPKSKRLEAQMAAFDDPVESDPPKPKDESPEHKSGAQIAPEKPWPLLYAVVALAVGLAAAFMYLAWVHFGMRSRYRMLLAEHLALTQPT